MSPAQIILRREIMRFVPGMPGFCRSDGFEEAALFYDSMCSSIKRTFSVNSMQSNVFYSSIQVLVPWEPIYENFTTCAPVKHPLFHQDQAWSEIHREWHQKPKL